jgi:hypothetical protein
VTSDLEAIMSNPKLPHVGTYEVGVSKATGELLLGVGGGPALYAGSKESYPDVEYRAAIVIIEPIEPSDPYLLRAAVEALQLLNELTGSTRPTVYVPSDDDRRRAKALESALDALGVLR